MSLIEKLTKEQEDQLVKYREKCLKIGLSCEPANRPVAENTITEMYTLIGKVKPMYFWFEGQMTAELAINILKDNLGVNLRDNLRIDLRDNLRTNLEANLEANLGVNLRTNLEANLGVNLWTNLGDNLWDNLWGNLGANLRDNLWDNLWDNLRANLRDNLWANLWGNLWGNNLEYISTNLWGQMEIYWIAYYKYPHQYLRKMHQKNNVIKLNYWERLAESCSWWWAYENICIISERPLEIHKKDIQLHKDGGPAFVSRDGWKM